MSYPRSRSTHSTYKSIDLGLCVCVFVSAAVGNTRDARLIFIHECPIQSFLRAAVGGFSKRSATAVHLDYILRRRTKSERKVNKPILKSSLRHSRFSSYG